jgi:hypothetical protein
LSGIGLPRLSYHRATDKQTSPNDFAETVHVVIIARFQPDIGLMHSINISIVDAKKRG